MKIYTIYISIPEKYFNERLKYLLPAIDKYNYKYKDDNVIALYAWTDKKKYVKRFLEERCSKVFNVKTIDIEFDVDYEEFRSENKESCLYEENIALFPYHDAYERYANITPIDRDNFTRMLTTPFEVYNFAEYQSQNMDEFGPKISAEFDYEIFNDEIIDALKVLGYVTMYDSEYSQYVSDEERRIERFESAMEVMNQIDYKDDCITPLIHTEYVAFIYLYSYTFIGE